MKEFNEQNITRRSNLEVHDSISCYLNHGAQQNPHVYKMFFDLLNLVKPARILEIGTAQGGFTMFLRLCCNDLDLSTHILSYDVNGRHGYDLLKESNIDIRVENIFDDKYENVKQEVIDYIKQDGLTIVLCDGGYKIGEFNLLSKYIKTGDIIMAHDYASTTEYFKENVYMKYWNWHEIQDLDIKKSTDEYGLVSFMQEEFNKSVWVCKIKK